MKKSRMKRILPILVILFFIFIVAFFLINGLNRNKISLSGIIGIKNESMYIIITLGFLLLIFLIILIVLLIIQADKFKIMNKYGVGIDVKGNVVTKYSRLQLKTDKTIMNSKDATGNITGIGNSNGISRLNKEEKDENNRFYMLTEIDKKYCEKIDYEYNNKINLNELCESFRNYASYNLKLYYSITDIRRFISSLAVSHILILQGMSGTGKTSLAYAFGQFIKNESTVVPIQPMWKERTDLLGYYNEFTKRFNETVLLNKIYEANYNDNIYITVLDEMNIARVEYYFAEFLSLLELPNPESRYLDVVSDKWQTDPVLLKEGQVKLPDNMWFIGTANNDDSTFAISDKVYDRAMVMNLDNKSVPFDAEKTKCVSISKTYFISLVEEAKKEYKITRRSLERIKKLDKYMIDTFHITFGNRIMKQIKQYVPVFIACGGEELEAIDDILSRKVIRKLESQNPVYVRKVAKEFMDTLDEIFGYDKMKLCKEYIELIARVS